MTAKLIKTETEYDAALERMETLFDSKHGSASYDEAELLITLISIYENEHHKIEAPDPIEALKFRMEQMKMTRADLIKYLGTRGRISEILSRKRKLSLAMRQKLHKELGIPAESLLS